MRKKLQQTLHRISLNKAYWPEKFSVQYLNLKDCDGNDLAIFGSDYNTFKAYLLKGRIRFDQLSDLEKYQHLSAAQVKIIKYFSPRNLAQHELNTTKSSFRKSGTILSSSGASLKKGGHQNCIVFHQGKIYIHPKVKPIPGMIQSNIGSSHTGLIGVSHSSLCQGSDVSFAGSLTHSELYGWVIENTTGHYSTRAYQIILMLDVLSKRGVALEDFTVKIWVPRYPHLKPPSPDETDYDVQYENAAAMLNRMNQNKGNIDRQLLTTARINGYRAALQSPTLDSSDYILLVTSILTETLSTNDPHLQKVKTNYFNHQYDDAIKTLHVLCDIHIYQVHPSLYLDIIKKYFMLKDQPLKNDSRRYFDTKVASYMKEKLSSEDFNSMNKLNQFLKQYIPTGLAIELQPHVLSFENIAHVFTSLRIITDKNPVILTEHDAFRASSILYSHKDRGPQIPDQHHLPSLAPGIMRSTTMLPEDDRVPLHMDRVPDLFSIRQRSDGFSTMATDAPFVNSLSGSGYTLIYMLTLYIKSNVNHLDLHKDIYSILSTWLMFTCYEGYHSFYEMMAVLSDPLVIHTFAQHGIALDMSGVANHVLDKAFDNAATYATTLGQKRSVLDAITQSVRQAHIKEVNKFIDHQNKVETSSTEPWLQLRH